ncbi:MAG: DUF3048 domain-containing protein [Patescibacteria group bacterium]
MNKLVIGILSLIIYAVAAFLSYNVFLEQKSTQTTPVASDMPLKTNLENDYQAILFNPNEPKTEVCPLTGEKYSKTQRNWWEKHRPLGVMVENHLDARPQSGINASDVTFEAVAEGGITRTLNIYYCNDAGIVGPVRSARTYFLDLISGYGNYPLYAHVGGANTPGPANALGQIVDYGWAQHNDINQFSVGYPTFWRDEGRLGRQVATEHTMYSNTTKLWEVGQKRKLTNVDKNGKSWDSSFTEYTFKDDAPAAAPQTDSIHIDFWNNPDYAVEWTYDPKTNTYLRENGGIKHNDRNTKKQIATKNLVILSMEESRANDGYEGNAHMIYGTTGTGNVTIFMDGKEIEGTWKKARRVDPLVIMDAQGEEIAFNKGKIWFEIQPVGSLVEVN